MIARWLMRGLRVLLLAALSCASGLLAWAQPQPATCVTYNATACAFARYAMDNRLCHPQACFFHTKMDFKCLLPESGTFVHNTMPEGGCPDPFMKHGGEPARPCGGRCCRADLQGEFAITGNIHGTCANRYEYQPTDSGCMYDEITRGQILDYLSEEQTGIVVAGDSMLRQLYVRLVTMMRGQVRLLDPHLQTHHQYRVCREMDMFRVSTNTQKEWSITFNSTYLDEQIATFFTMRTGPGAHTVRHVLDKCSSQPVPMDYLHAPDFSKQTRAVRKYMEMLPPNYKPIVLLGVGYWVHASYVSKDYMDLLRMLGTRSRRVYIVTIPRIKVLNAEWSEMYRQRNVFLRDWVREMGPPFEILDFEAMAGAPYAPPGGTNNNWHYMCSITWLERCRSCELVHMDYRNGLTPNGYKAAQVKGQPDFITATDDGHCADEMNRNLWQAVFNTEMGHQQQFSSRIGSLYEEEEDDFPPPI